MLHWLEINLELKRVDQEKKWFCGPACAEMILEYYGADINQALAYNSIKSEEDIQKEQLYSTPHNLGNYINSANDGTEMLDVDDISIKSKRLAIDLIFKIILTQKAPIALLSQGGNHWIVIKGIRYADTLDGPRSYAGVYIQNPWKYSTPNIWISMDEFYERWLTPNKFGRSWLGKIVFLGNCDDLNYLKNNTVFNQGSLKEIDVNRVELNPIVNQMDGLGFYNTRDVVGGGGTATNPIIVNNESNGDNYYINSLDAIDNKEFNDFIYVVSDMKTGNILEISSQSTQLEVPSDDFVSELFSRKFPQEEIKVDSRIFWRERVGAVSKLDVYKTVIVKGQQFFITRSGNVKTDIDDTSKVGG